MADDQFRRQLTQVLDVWVAKGFIESTHRDKLWDYYQLDSLNASASGRFATVLLSIGALLIGSGIIVFIAANWAVIPHSLRAIGALSLMVGLQSLGFYLWQVPRWSNRWASTCLFIGELAMGASIGLMAQWFQVSGKSSGLFLAWSLGILAMAYGLRHAPTGALGIILWLIGFVSDQQGTPLWIYQPAVVPWFTAALLFPLAYWCRSRWIFACSSLIWLISLDILAWGIWESLGWPRTGTISGAYVFTMPILLGAIGLWCFSFWHRRLLIRLGFNTSDATEHELDFEFTAQFLSLISLIGLFYTWSFHQLWLGQYEYGSDRLVDTIQTFWFTPNAITVTLWGLAIGVLWLWWERLRHSFGNVSSANVSSANVNSANVNSANVTSLTESSKTDPKSVGLTDRAIGLSALSLLILLHTGAIWGLALVLVNLGLFVLGFVITWQGLQLSQRWRFWLGLLTVTLHIITRFFEYNTGLLPKSMALVVCGVGVILAGLKFEQAQQTQFGQPQ